MMQMAQHDALKEVEDAFNTNSNNGKTGSEGNTQDNARRASNDQSERTGSRQSGKAGSRPGSKTSVNGSRPGSKTSLNGARPSSKTSVNEVRPSSKTSVTGARPSSKTSLTGARPSSKTSLNGARPSSKTSLTGSRPSSKTSVNGQRPSSKTDRPLAETMDEKTQDTVVTPEVAPQDEQQQQQQQEQQQQPGIQEQQDAPTSADTKEKPELQDQEGQNEEQQPPAEQPEEQQQQPQQPQQPVEQPQQPQEQQQETKTEDTEEAKPEEEPELSPLQIRTNTVIANYKAKSMPKDDVVQTASDLMEILVQQDVWDTDMALDALKKITRIYFDYKSCRERVAIVMTEKGFPEACLKMYRKFNRMGIFSADNIWFPTYYILNNLWNFTDASTELSQDLAKIGFITLLTANITHQPYLDNKASKNVCYVLKSSLSILQNIVHKEGVRQYYEENNVVEALKPFLAAEMDMFLKTLAIMTLSVLVTEEENAKMEDSGTIPFIVKNVKNAMASTKGRSNGFTVMELSDTLGRIAANDVNKKKIVAAGALPLLVKMLESQKEDKQYAGARTLWTLCFDAEVKAQIAAEPGCLDALQALKDSDNSGVKKQVNGVLWKLEEDQNKKSAQEVVEQGIDGHVMISYNHADREVVKQIKEKLQACGYKVWVDYEQMGGSTLEAMALAVENACCVLVCLSEKYKLSPNCRTEAEYTFQLKKPLVPLMMQRYYKPDGWLGMLCGAKMYINFDGKYELDFACDMLKKELTNLLAATDGVDGGAPLVKRSETPAVNTFAAPASAPAKAPAPAPTASFRKWSAQEVEDWVTKQELQGCASTLTGLDGKKLYQLCQMKAQAPEFFFNYLSAKENLALNDILQLTDAMEQLK